MLKPELGLTKRDHYISIRDLNVGTENHHIQRNKLSEKMGRRDIQFYDLYKLNEPISAVQELRQEGYWTEGIYDT
jgi:hypothetical protein